MYFYVKKTNKTKKLKLKKIMQIKETKKIWLIEEKTEELVYSSERKKFNCNHI